MTTCQSTMLIRCSVTIFILLQYTHGFYDNDDDEAGRKIDATNLGLRFKGNDSVNDYFKLLERDGNFLLIGARNVVYNISIETFDVQTMIFWPSLDEDVDMCIRKGKSKDDCHNYIRILAKDNETGILVCGTNAYKPLCRRYLFRDGAYEIIAQFSASGVSPYDPTHNSTAYYWPATGEIFSGTVADFVGADALISKRNISKPEDLGLRTERNDMKCLNEPNFVSSFADDDHVYFWLRENAVEYMNCGKAVYSRVARVCKNDKGGPRAYADFWTTFLKARLNCSLPGEYPFYFDEIAATSSIITDRNGEPDLVYAVFNTPYSTIRGLAVCAYSMQDIRKIFRHSAFKTQQNPNSNWLPVMRSSMPQPRPGDCETDSRLLSDESMNFVRKNSLLDAVVPNFFDQPLIVKTGFSRFTYIAVDPQVLTVDKKRYDVIFIATDDGKVLKMVNLAEGSTAANSAILETLQIFGRRAIINNMQIFKSRDRGEIRLIVVSDDEIRSVPVQQTCRRAKTCGQCVGLQDPYCAWDAKNVQCAFSNGGNWIGNYMIQNVTSGFSSYCTGDKSENTASGSADSFSNRNLGQYAKNFSELNSCKCSNENMEQLQKIAVLDNSDQNEKNFASVEKLAYRQMYTAENLAIAVIVTMVISIIFGLGVGYQLSKYKNLVCKLKNKTVAADKSVKCKKSPQHKQNHVMYSNGSKKPLSLSLNSSPINAYDYDPPTNFGTLPNTNELDIRLTNSNPDYSSYSTLPKDYRVKKTYL